MAQEYWSKQSFAAVKEECAKRKLNTAGGKEILVRRLVDAGVTASLAPVPAPAAAPPTSSSNATPEAKSAFSLLSGPKPDWLKESLERDAKPAKEEVTVTKGGVTGASLPTRILYEDFWKDYRIFLPGFDPEKAEGEQKPADVKKVVQEIMETLKKEHPAEIDLNQYGETKIFMNREQHGEIEIMKQQMMREKGWFLL